MFQKIVTLAEGVSVGLFLAVISINHDRGLSFYKRTICKRTIYDVHK